MSAPALHIGVASCRLCRRPILASIARCLGSDIHGFTCPDCLIKEVADRHWLSSRLAEESNVETKVVLMPGSPFACVICGNTDDDHFYRQVPIDGKVGYVCAGQIPMSHACERKWAEGHRSYFSNHWQRRLKLV